MDYQARLRALREDRDLTQSFIGRLINKSQQGYSHIESGRAELKLENLYKLCEFYNVSADFIVGLISEPKSFNR